ncbi:PREDICTED: zinc finger protein 653 [Nanorana parkeri]|uniref:zinc finger protein 653 n=1 Tax=Nanorana parkeri TaxID=125878 RepID=UPI000854A717|nr:PREDICTED: zinc finger protein 653 [Nanorana parkeri]
MAAPLAAEGASSEDDEDSGGRKVRGRPRLTDTDRVRRRLESRKKYDCRRVYLGEAHGAWVQRREKGAESEGGAWTDAKLAAYLLELEARGGNSFPLNGPMEPSLKPHEEHQTGSPHRTRQRDCVNNLLSLVTWYCGHKSHCPHEPGLSELNSGNDFYTTVVWQCQAGHHFYQELHCPLKALNQMGYEDGAESDDDSSRSAPLSQSTGTCLNSEQPVHALYSQPLENVTQGEAVCTDDTETVVCVPMESAARELFEGVTQEALGQVVAAGCPSQVIIIAGPGYEALAAEGIQLDMANGCSEEEGTGTVLEAVSAFTQTDAEEQEEEQSGAVTMTEEDALYTLEGEPEECEAPRLVLSSQLPDADSMEELSGPGPLVSVDCQAENTAQVPREPEKKKNRRSRAADADGVLEMFHCPYEGCAQVYTALASFQNHINLVHRKGRTKVCPEAGCGKKFYLSNHLRRHMIIHTGIREFICETCGKSFKRKSHLEVHRRTHTGETPLQCEVCGYQCRQRASLNWHMKKHGSEIQYSFSCEHCGKLFEKRESVKFHKLKSHPEGEVT